MDHSGLDDVYERAARAHHAVTTAAGHQRREISLSANPAFRAAVDAAREDLAAEVARVTAELGKARADIAEEIARAIEVNHGTRCDKCGGEPASLKWGRRAGTLDGRCGCGHTWAATRRDGYWRRAEDIAREVGRD